MFYDLGKAIMLGLAIVTTLAFALGALAMWGIPKLWELVKPFLHTLTA